MSLSAQAKFLRVLQEHEFQRLGANTATRWQEPTSASSRRPIATCGKPIEPRDHYRDDLFYHGCSSFVSHISR